MNSILYGGFIKMVNRLFPKTIKKLFRTSVPSVIVQPNYSLKIFDSMFKD